MKHSFSHSIPGIILYSIFGLLWFNSCREPEPFPDEPRIVFNKLEFVRVTENGFQDSLILFFDFEDGDGDLGLYPEENFEPFHDFNIVVDANDRIVTFNDPLIQPPLYEVIEVLSQSGQYISFEKRLLDQNDVRPAYSCQSYDTIKVAQSRDLLVQTMDNNGNIIAINPGYLGKNFIVPSGPDAPIYELDTVFLIKNDFRHNIFVEFEVNNGTEGNPIIETLDWEFVTSEFGCGDNFNGRFQVLDADNIGTSLQGTIKYSMVSLGFDLVLRNRPFQLKFYIVDRQLRVSNVVETGFVTLSDLIVRGQLENQEE